jgi:hypothetical protein
LTDDEEDPNPPMTKKRKTSTTVGKASPSHGGEEGEVADVGAADLPHKLRVYTGRVRGACGRIIDALRLEADRRAELDATPKSSTPTQMPLRRKHVRFTIALLGTYLFFFQDFVHLHMMKKTLAEKVPLKEKKKASHAIVPPTPDVPPCQGAPTSSPIPKAITMPKALAKDTVPITVHVSKSEKMVPGGSSMGKDTTVIDAAGGSKWKKQMDCLIHLDNLQEKAIIKISSAMTSFVERTDIVKKVCERTFIVLLCFGIDDVS